MDPETLEALTCREGLALAKDLLIGCLVLASNCSNVVRSIKGEAMRSYGRIVQEIKVTAKDFLSVRFIHEHRESNLDAHSLARSSLYKGLGRHIWFFDPPLGIVPHTPFMINKILASC